MTKSESHSENSRWFTPALQRIARTQFGFHLLLQVSQFRDFGMVGYVKWQAALLAAWMRERKNRRIYRILSEGELSASRKSDTVFIFGSGYSLNGISPEEWRHFQYHDTLGFTGFVYQKWVRVDYHLIRGWVEAKAGALNWQAHTRDFADILNANEYFNDTILIMQGEYLAQFCNGLIGHALLRPGTQIFRYKTARCSKNPTRQLKDGLSHTVGTLSDAVNFAYCNGWKHLVLVGVDLYDSRYFWLKEDETTGVDKATGMLVPSRINHHGQRFDQTHNTARNGIVETLGRWREVFHQEGVRLSVYNPRSLLRDVLPPYVTQ